MVKAVKSTDNYNLDSFELHYYYDDKKDKTNDLFTTIMVYLQMPMKRVTTNF